MLKICISSRASTMLVYDALSVGLITIVRVGIFSLSLTFLSVFLAIFAFQGFMHVYGILINENTGLMRMLPGFLLPYVCISALFFLLYPILVKEMSKKRKIIHSSIFFALELVLLILFLTEAKFHFSGFLTRTWTFLLF